MMAPNDPALGVVVPALNEAGELEACLEALRSLGVPLQVVVADGGSEDGTASVARAHGVRLVRALQGRASQMNAGARALPGAQWLLFLHADTRVGPKVGTELRSWLQRRGTWDAGAFRFRLRGRRWLWRTLEAGQRARERATGIPYGDQGLLVSRDAFRAAGGYPELPIMEDVAMVRRLRALGVRMRRLHGEVRTSPRRYEREGPARAVGRNALLMALFTLGASPERLARWYRPEPGPQVQQAPAPPPAGSRDRRLLVFVKEPRPGQVKTRLARSVGADEAAALYRAMGRRVVDTLRQGPFATEVHFAPAHAGEPVKTWLGHPGLAFVPQGEGDLGQRLEAAIRSAFRNGASAVAAVGTDTPDLTRERVVDAFERLRDADAVLGPATDGGYYLIALSAPHRDLFHEIPWSTHEVLDATLERARQQGLTVALLPELPDVDRPEDLRELARHPELPYPTPEPDRAPATPIPESHP